MPIVTPVPRLRYARKGANPSLELIEYVRAALLAAGEPVSRNHLLRVLAEWNHTTTRRSLNAVLSFFVAHGLVEEGRRGVLWMPTATPEVVQALRAGRRI
jgi:hypothetical protein